MFSTVIFALILMHLLLFVKYLHTVKLIFFFLSEGGGGHAHSSSRNLVFVKKCSSLGGNIFCSQEGYV